MSRTQQMLAMLTGAYAQIPTSNIGKLYSILGDEFDRIAAVFEKIRLWRSLQAASGAVLDRKGGNYSVDRAGADDPTYRLVIKAKRMASYAGGDPDTLIRSTASLLSVADSDVYLSEGGAQATLVVNEADVPIEVFDRLDAVTSMLQQAAAAGVLLILELQTPIRQQMEIALIIQDAENTTIRQVN